MSYYLHRRNFLRAGSALVGGVSLGLATSRRVRANSLTLEKLRTAHVGGVVGSIYMWGAPPPLPLLPSLCTRHTNTHVSERTHTHARSPLRAQKLPGVLLSDAESLFEIVDDASARHPEGGGAPIDRLSAGYVLLVTFMDILHTIILIFCT